MCIPRPEEGYKKLPDFFSFSHFFKTFFYLFKKNLHFVDIPL